MCNSEKWVGTKRFPKLTEALWVYPDVITSRPRVCFLFLTNELSFVFIDTRPSKIADFNYWTQRKCSSVQRLRFNTCKMLKKKTENKMILVFCCIDEQRHFCTQEKIMNFWQRDEKALIPFFNKSFSQNTMH